MSLIIVAYAWRSQLIEKSTLIRQFFTIIQANSNIAWNNEDFAVANV